MIFCRLFGSGVDTKRTDPRDKIFAEYKCTLCSEISDVDVTGMSKSFDYDKERRCPKCHLINSEDREINLKSQLEKLTLNKSRIEIEIEKVIRELNNITSSKEVN